VPHISLLRCGSDASRTSTPTNRAAAGLLLYSVHTMLCVRGNGQFRCLALLFISLSTLFPGCGTPGAPQPPSLNLPDRVADLSATRVGNQVSLTWTMPRRNTDRIPLKGDINAHICRRESNAGDQAACVAAGERHFPPTAEATFAETLPAAFTSGPSRTLTYYVELRNSHGRSAGPSNSATVLAGEAPAPVASFAAEVRKQGIVLRWTATDPGASIRLQRKLLTPPPARPSTGPLPAAPEPIEQNLLIESAPHSTPAQAIDKNIVFGNTYEYRAQRVIRVASGTNTLELDGELSPPIRVQALDVFPPAVPLGLATVATPADTASSTSPSIDLSWQPNTEPDLAGYEVYRREDQTPWQRISADQPVIGPAFHDAHVLPGHTYRYGVSAVDKGGHESGRSAEASETVPNP